jgi:hypothetical protein
MATRSAVTLIAGWGLPADKREFLRIDDSVPVQVGASADSQGSVSQVTGDSMRCGGVVTGCSTRGCPRRSLVQPMGRRTIASLAICV